MELQAFTAVSQHGILFPLQVEEAKCCGLSIATAAALYPGHSSATLWHLVTMTGWLLRFLVGRAAFQAKVLFNFMQDKGFWNAERFLRVSQMFSNLKWRHLLFDFHNCDFQSWTLPLQTAIPKMIFGLLTMDRFLASKESRHDRTKESLPGSSEALALVARCLILFSAFPRFRSI